MDLQQLLAYLEDHIDPARREAAEQLHIDTMDFRPVPYMPLTVTYPRDERIKPFDYSASVEDYGKMLYNELAAGGVNVLNSVEIGDTFPLQIRGNYGIGLICSLFGLKSKIRMENMPWVEHLDSADDLRPIVDRGVPDPDTALGRTVRECCEYFRETLAKYPKCARYIHITQPDLQSPFDILHLMLGSDMFYALYDEPELVHQTLDLISDTYIRYHRYIMPYTTSPVDGGRKCVVHFDMYGGNLVLKDDTATATLSEAMYEEFVAPYNTKILRALAPENAPGAGSIHFCGERKEWHYRQMAAQPVNCLNFGNPEMHDYGHAHAPLTERKICLVGMGQNSGYEIVREMKDCGLNTGVTFLVKAGSREEAKQIFAQHVNG